MSCPFSEKKKSHWHTVCRNQIQHELLLTSSKHTVSQANEMYQFSSVKGDGTGKTSCYALNKCILKEISFFLMTHISTQSAYLFGNSPPHPSFFFLNGDLHLLQPFTCCNKQQTVQQAVTKAYKILKSKCILMFVLNVYFLCLK